MAAACLAQPARRLEHGVLSEGTAAPVGLPSVRGARGAVFTKGFGAPASSQGSAANSGEAPPRQPAARALSEAQSNGAQRKHEEKRALGEHPAKAALTMQKAVVFEAAAAEEGVEGVQGLLPLDRLRAGPVDVGGALRRQHVGVRHLRQLPVPVHKQKHPQMHTLS